MPKPSEVSLETRFWMRSGYVDPRTNDCMLWMGHRTAQGYGQMKDAKGKVHYAHRVAYELTHGPIPEGMVIRHRCPEANGGPNPSCCRPGHLEIGTYSDNAMDIQVDGRQQVIDPPCTHVVRGLRHLYKSGKFSQRQLSEFLFGGGMHQPTVQRIVSGKSHVAAGGPITKRGRGKKPSRRVK